MNKKQLIVTSILLSLMLLLSIVQCFFNRNFEQVVLISNGINEFKEYNFNNNSYIISLPDQWNIVKTNDKTTNDIINFTDCNNKLTGTLQIISTSDYIDSFAEKDCKNQSLSYSNLEIIPYKDKKNNGILSTYNTSIKNGYNFRNQCYYLQLEKGKIVKLLFNVKEKNYKENIKTVFTSIVSSIDFA